MGWFSWLFGGYRSSNNDQLSDSNDRRCAKDGTCFRDTTDGEHVVIERPTGGKPSVGHYRGRRKCDKQEKGRK